MYLLGKRSLLLVLAFGLVAGLQAQPQSRTGDADALPDYHVERLTSDDGLSSNSVISIAQDAQGFMWFGTWGGLNRYDGSSFKTFYHDPTDPTSMPHDWVESLYLDGKGTLWVGMHAGGGLARFDPATETFTRFSLRDDSDDPAQGVVTVILEDHAGTFWVGTHGGLIRFDRETGAFTRYRHNPDDPTSLSNDQVRAMYVDRSGTLWVGTGSPTPSETPAGLGGLNRFDPATGRFIRYLHDPDDPTTLFDNKVRAIFEDVRGTLWVGTFGNVLNRMDRQTGTFERLMFDPITPDRLVRPPVSSLRNLCSVDCGQLPFIRQHPSGLLWIGSNRDGLLLYDADRNRVVRRYHADVEDAARSFGPNSAWSFHAGVDGTVWVGNAEVGGVHRLVPAAERFAHLQADPANLNHRGVRQIIATRDGMVWMATWDGGLNRYDPATQAYTHYRSDPADPNSLSDLDVHSIYEDRQGLLWIGTGAGGLNRFDRATGRFTHYRHDPTDPHSIGSDDVLEIRENQDGTFWILFDFGGLDRFTLETGRFTHYRHDPADPNSLSSDGVSDLLEDQNGDLWVGSFSGLDRIVRDTVTGTISFERHLPGTWVSDLYKDRAGRFWVATFNAGLLLFDRATDGFTRFTHADGLPENSIRSMAEDDAGHLWISTPNRLVRFEPEPRTFFVFDRDDGLPNIQFLARSVARGRDGTLYFGGRGGITAFDPTPPLEDLPPKTTLTGLRLRNTPVVPGPNAPLRQPLFKSDEIILTHTQNDFTINYLGLDYRRPGRVRYQYVLEGHDAGWVDARGQRSARYAAVRPGNYVFRVRAANRFGVWQGEPTSVRVTVLPPWWRTWWAYVLYALILGVGIFVVNRLQQRRLIRQERAKAEIEQVRLRAEAAEILRESEQRFRELFEASADAIFVEDFEGKVLDVNPAAGRLHGLERAQLIGQNVRALVPPEEREHVMEKVARMVSGDLVRFEGKSWTVAEEKVPVEISVSHVTFARGPALLLQVRDVTERKQAEEEREKARKEREKVLQREKELRVQAAEMSSLLKKMFGRYLSAEVMNTLIENPSALELGGERKKVTIMMTDLRGFTALSERLEPEQVVQMLNTYFEIMVDLVLKYNGTVNEFIGDSLLVIFGAPQEMEDRAQRAVACSIEMQNAMVEVNNRNSAEGLPEIEMGIGLNETEVIVGNIGSSKRSKYAIVGSGVNLTSRIESYTVGGQILVSESVRKEAGEVLRIDAQRDVFPKGAEASLRIYEVGGISGPYNLVLVKKVQVLTTLVRQIPLQYTVIEGKKVGEKELEGCVVRLSKSSAEITLGGPVELLNNLKLKLKDVDEQLSARDFYGKVIKRSAEKENTYIVSFTSLPSEVDAYFQACRQYAAGAIASEDA